MYSVPTFCVTEAKTLRDNVTIGKRPTTAEREIRGHQNFKARESKEFDGQTQRE